MHKQAELREAFEEGRCEDGPLGRFVDVEKVVERRRHRVPALRQLVVEATVEGSPDKRPTGCDWLHVDDEPPYDTFYRACGFQPTLTGLQPLQ